MIFLIKNERGVGRWAYQIILSSSFVAILVHTNILYNVCPGTKVT